MPALITLAVLGAALVLLFAVLPWIVGSIVRRTAAWLYRQ